MRQLSAKLEFKVRLALDDESPDHVKCVATLGNIVQRCEMFYFCYFTQICSTLMENGREM